jgi:hypothetical protein
MLRIKGDSEEVIIREMPVLQWFNAAVVALCLFLFALLMIAYGTDLAVLAWSSVIFAPIAGFLIYLLTRPSITIKINRPGQTVSVRKRSLFRYDFNVYSFSEIADAVYVERRKDVFNDDCQLFLPLKNAPPIALSLPTKLNQADYFEAADLMNKYISAASKQIPSKSLIFGDD